MSDIGKLTRELVKFRDARDWKQFHNPKDIALSLSLEAAEVLEHFQWKNGADLEKYLKGNKNKIGEELADVFNWVLILSDELGVDIVKASQAKIRQNAKKYPIRKSKGKYAKYSEL